MSSNIKLMNSDALLDSGLFSAEEIANAKNNPDGFVGSKNGMMYFRTDVDLKMGDLEMTGKAGEIPDLQGDGTNRKGSNMPARY